MTGAPLAKCVDNDKIYQYNREKGLSDYIDPFTKLFCVYVDNSPKMDYYYTQVTDISNDEIDRLLNNQIKKGFAATMYPMTSISNKYDDYNEGASLKLNQTKSAYLNGFSLPKPNMNGMCDNF